MPNELAVNIRNLEYRFRDSDRFRLQIQDLAYRFNGVLGLYGLSGSGKTTFSKLLAGIFRPVAGTVSFVTDSSLSVPKIIYSPQFPEKILLGIQVGDTIQQIVSGSKASGLYDSIRAYLQKFSLDFNQIKNKSGFELSGGELRRLAIALCLALSPDLLILDEPTIGLGRKGKSQLYALLEEFRQHHHIMIVSHDFQLIRNVCSHFWILNQGDLIFNGNLKVLENRQDIVEKVGINALANYLNANLKSEEIITR